MRRLVSLIMGLLLVAVAGAGVAAQPAEPNPDCTYFEETGHNLCEPFEPYWNTNGGLPVFGYPITEAANEVNLDLGEEFLTQYFERERMEHHPENAGTPYEILLGRLGNEVLLEMGRNWFTFPQADPSEEHYFAETGHAIDPAFWEYWSSHGLDLGEEGISFAESLALFGYPISEAEMETNTSGDTVLTQWFERARFELHGEEVLLGLLGNELLELRGGPGGPPEPPGEVIAEGLNNARHLNVAADGAVYVAEAGATGENCVAPDPEAPDDQVCLGDTGRITVIPPDGEGQPFVAGLPSVGGPDGFGASGPHDVMMGADGILRVLLGLGAPARDRDQLFPEDGAMLGTLQSWNADDSFSLIADIAAWEDENNPDETSDFPVGADSNPYGFAMLEDGSYLVADAGGNTLLHVGVDGAIEVVAIFEPRMVDLPPEFVEPGGPTQIPMAAVPTSVEVGPDGAYYVGQLTGFPFPVGGANVYRVTPEGEVTVYADGFSAIVDIAFDAQGNLYVVEMAKNGLFGAETAEPDDFEAMTGAVTMVTPEGERTEIASEGLILPGGVDVGADGTVYVTNYSIMPGMGQVLALTPDVGPPPPGPEMTVEAEGLNSPRGISVTADGTVYVAEAGVGGDDCITAPTPEGEGEVCFGNSGQVTMIAGGEQSVAVPGLTSLDLGGGEASGPHDVVAGEDGLHVIVGGLGPGTPLHDQIGELVGQLGWILASDAEGAVTPAVDIMGYEIANNPHASSVDSNPFSLVSDGAGGWVASDAGGNDLLHIDAEGTITTLTVFEDRMAPPPGPPGQEDVPMQTVPTGVTRGPDGAFYVGELTGFPFQQGAARVWRVTAEGEATVYAEGFTNVIDVAFDADGNLYVLEMLAGGLLNANPEDPATLASRLVKVAPDGTQTTVVDVNGGLVFATGLAIGPDGTFYVSNFGVMPGMGQVVSFTLN